MAITKLMLRRRVAAGIALYLILFGLYAFTYNGLPVGADERYMVDSVESLLRRGNLLITMEFNTHFRQLFFEEFGINCRPGAGFVRHLKRLPKRFGNGRIVSSAAAKWL